MRRFVATGVLVVLIIGVSVPVSVSASDGDWNEVMHVVQPGDNLLQLSELYGTSVGALALANGLNSTVISVGQELIVPGADWPDIPNSEARIVGQPMTYVVRAGDYLGMVARMYGTTVNQIMEASRITSPLILTNQFLTIPALMTGESLHEVDDPLPHTSTTDSGENELQEIKDGVNDDWPMREELHNAGYPYAFTESIKEIRRVYSETVIKQDSKLELSELNADQTVKEYWAHVNGKRYEKAWSLLTDGFRNRVHDGEFQNYHQGYLDMDLCSVKVDHVEIESTGSEVSVVNAEVMYLTGADCADVEFSLVLTMHRSPSVGGWAIEAVAVTQHLEVVVPVSGLRGGGSRWIDVDIGSQRVFAMEGDKRVREFVASTGIDRYPTITGSFRVYVKHPKADMRGVDMGIPWYFPDVPHVMYFFRGYGIHGTYWHEQFGTPMSHGCINLSKSDAEWLYGFSQVGTLVNIHY